MPQFKKYKLLDLVEKERGISYGVVQPGTFLKDGIPFIRVNNLTEKKLSINDVEKIAPTLESKYKRTRLKGTELLVSLVGSLGHIGYVKEYMIGWNVARAVGVLPIKQEYDRDWIYWYLKSPIIQDALHNSATTSVQATINLKELQEIEINYPNEAYRKKATAILSSLDDKIELNRRTNATLEAMAQTLFKKYFVDDIDPDNLPDGWRYEKVESLFDISIGRTPPRVQREWFSNNHEDVKWISIKDMGNSGTYIFDTSEYLTKEAVKKFNVPVIPDNTVVLSFKLTVGRVAITTEKMLSNEAIAHFIPKKSTYLTPEYIFLFLKNFEYDSLGNTSSIATAVNSQTIKGINILVPDIEITNNFSSSVVALFKRIKTNQEEIKTLSQIRDSLLPKLMSGEIEVSAAENELVS